jgi:hypothetical protein
VHDAVKHPVPVHGDAPSRGILIVGEFADDDGGRLVSGV